MLAWRVVRKPVTASSCLSGTQLVPGRIRAFVSHSAPGYDPATKHEANITDVKLSAQVLTTNVAAQKSIQVLGFLRGTYLIIPKAIHGQCRS